MANWIACDLDGTLAHYDGWKGYEHIGEPIQEMVERVKKWKKEGMDVRIFTARFSLQNKEAVAFYIDAWCLEHLGFTLPITCTKEFGMLELWDDLAIQIIPNTGKRVDGN